MKAIKTKYWISLLQFFGWILIITISFFWSAHSQSDRINTFGLLMLIFNLVPLLFIYAFNNFLFIPFFLFREKKTSFLLLNLVFLIILLILSYYIDEREIARSIGFENVPKRRSNDLTFLARDMVNNILMIGFVTALKLMGRLQQSEEALREAENAKIKAELANLRSQINPHFLLNTLNNIYALTAIDSEKAQKTIKELSFLLRYVLYDNLTEKVLLIKEVEFLQNYIELMRIRLTNQVKLSVEYNIKPDSSTQIAPLIFISLIENAFKHGVSADKPSFIEIKIEDNTQTGEISLSIRNSNNAKDDNDKSGKGVGLDQVSRRLELQYANAFNWTINKNKDVYESFLTLKS